MGPERAFALAGLILGQATAWIVAGALLLAGFSWIGFRKGRGQSTLVASLIVLMGAAAIVVGVLVLTDGSRGLLAMREVGAGHSGIAARGRFHPHGQHGRPRDLNTLECGAVLGRGRWLRPAWGRGRGRGAAVRGRGHQERNPVPLAAAATLLIWA